MKTLTHIGLVLAGFLLMNAGACTKPSVEKTEEAPASPVEAIEKPAQVTDEEPPVKEPAPVVKTPDIPKPVAENPAFIADMDYLCKMQKSADKDWIFERQWLPVTRKVMQGLASVPPGRRYVYLQQASEKNGYPNFECDALKD